MLQFALAQSQAALPDDLTSLNWRAAPPKRAGRQFPLNSLPLSLLQNSIFRKDNCKMLWFFRDRLYLVFYQFGDPYVNVP